MLKSQGGKLPKVESEKRWMNVYLHRSFFFFFFLKHATKEQCVSRLHGGLRLSCVCLQKYPMGLKYTHQTRGVKTYEEKTLIWVRIKNDKFLQRQTETKTLHQSSSSYPDKSSNHCYRSRSRWQRPCSNAKLSNTNCNGVVFMIKAYETVRGTTSQALVFNGEV